jgi:hypothetical protein
MLRHSLPISESRRRAALDAYGLTDDEHRQDTELDQISSYLARLEP